MRMLIEGVESNSIERMAGADDEYRAQFVEDDGTPIDLTVALTVAQIMFYTASARAGLTPVVVGLTVDPVVARAQNGYAILTIGDTTAPFTGIGIAQYGYGKHTVNDAVGTINVTNKGTGYTVAPGVTFTGGTPSVSASAVANLTNGVLSVPITNPGQGFTVVPTVALAGVTGAVATVTVGGCPLSNSPTIQSGGSGYTETPGVVITAPTGSKALQATAIAVLTGGIGVITVGGGGGAGYTSTPNVAISGGGGAGATAVATVVGGVVTAITVVNRGTGYTDAGSLVFTITGGGGAGCTATATLTGVVQSIVMTNVGDGYLSGAYSISFTGGGGGAGAAATVALGSTAGSGITSITVSEPGYAAGAAITVSLTNTGGGTGATFGTAVLTGRVMSITLLNGGAGYSGVPIVGFTGGGGGINAAATAFLDGGDIAIASNPVVITSR